jgi:tRNA pseudouridine55 synthase
MIKFKISGELLQEGEILPFDKPYDWTSFSLVNKVRYHLCRQLGIKKLKVGHAGTLDPLATGLLILCTGNATKSIDKIQEMPKEYITEITLGATTPSFDLETGIDKTYDIGHISYDLIQKKIQLFSGKIEQVPPIFSAKYVNGVRAYELARAGVIKELKPSSVEIYKIEVLNYTAPVLKLKILCSKGTYIRSLARDIGIELNSGGHLSALRRTKIGSYSIERAMNVEIFLKEKTFL